MERDGNAVKIDVTVELSVDNKDGDNTEEEETLELRETIEEVAPLEDTVTLSSALKDGKEVKVNIPVSVACAESLTS